MLPFALAGLAQTRDQPTLPWGSKSLGKVVNHLEKGEGHSPTPGESTELRTDGDQGERAAADAAAAKEIEIMNYLTFEADVLDLDVAGEPNESVHATPALDSASAPSAGGAGVGSNQGGRGGHPSLHADLLAAGLDASSSDEGEASPFDGAPLNSHLPSTECFLGGFKAPDEPSSLEMDNWWDQNHTLHGESLALLP